MFGWANDLSYAILKIQDLLAQVHRLKYYTIFATQYLCGFKIIFHNIVVSGNVIKKNIQILNNHAVMLMVAYCSESYIVLIKYTNKSIYTYHIHIIKILIFVYISHFITLFYLECDVHKAKDDYS